MLPSTKQSVQRLRCGQQAPRSIPTESVHDRFSVLWRRLGCKRITAPQAALYQRVPVSASITGKNARALTLLLPQVKQVLHSKVSRSFTEYRAIAGKSFIDPRDLTKVSRVDDFVCQSVSTSGTLPALMLTLPCPQAIVLCSFILPQLCTV